MILLRLILILTAIALVMSFGLYVLTNDNRYLRYTRQIVRFVVFVLLILGALYLLEREVLVGWGILV
ncbi:MAG TPA: hypothetical protein VIU46_07525 [Gallionellaceae bacterium]